MCQKGARSSQEETQKPGKDSGFRLIARDHETSKKASNTPDRIRTCDLWFRKPMLYPTELRAQVVIFKQYMLFPVVTRNTKLQP